MKHRLNRIVFMLILAAGAAARAADGDGYDLRPIWTEGQVSRYRITQTELTVQQIQGMTEPAESVVELGGEVTWQIIKTPGPGQSGGTARMTLDKLTMKITDPSGTKLEVDGRGSDPATEGLRTWINAITGAPLEVSVGPDGTIGHVSGFKAIQDKAGPAGEKLDESYFQEIAMDLAVLVGGPAGAKPGAKWSEQHDGSHRMGIIHFDSTYNLTGVEKIAGIDVAMINRNSKMTFEPDMSDVPANAPPIKVRTVKATQSSQIMFDTTRHEVVGSNGDQTLELEISLTLGGRTLVRTNKEVTSTQVLRISEE
ncbi:MAG: hypothetical protein GC162_20115 [Planctomycetes bacterium]|nr:hypothetical protein [Planctomycetota bacterium]